MKHLGIICSLMFHLHGIGTRGTWFSIETDGASLKLEFDVVAHFHLSCLDAIVFRKNSCCQLAGSHYCSAFRQSTEHAIEIGLLNNFKILVGGCALGTPYSKAGVEQRYACTGKEVFQGLQMVSLVLRIDEVHLVIKKTDAENTPHVVGEVGIIPWHAPTFGRRGECAKHEKFGIGGEKGGERVGFSLSPQPPLPWGRGSGMTVGWF